jgi:hypothetical protein
MANTTLFKAFPLGNQVSAWQNGMDLRDYFAAHAMQMISYPETLNQYNTESFKTYMVKACACCYQIADAMMEARYDTK